MQAILTELRRKTTAVVRASQQGRAVEITERGKVIVELQARRPGLSGAAFAKLWRSRHALDAETAREVLSNIRATEEAECKAG